MRTRSVTTLLIILACTGAASFVVGRSAGSAQPAASGRGRPAWLEGASDKAVGLERQFIPQVDQLDRELRLQQDALLGLLEDPAATDAQVTGQVSVVGRCREDLIKAVANHVMQLGGAMTPAQQAQLMHSCGQVLQQQMQRRVRWRGGASQSAAEDRPRGMGRGQRYRWGRRGGALQQELRLTDDQIAIQQQLDPQFETEAARLREQIAAARAALLSVFQDSQVRPAQFASAVEGLVAAHDAMEQRAARHVLLLRPHLTSEQIRRLVGMCRGPSGL